MKSAYMHTVDNEPAWFNGTQIILADNCVKRLARDLEQIRREQMATIRYRSRSGFPIYRYSYTRVITETNK